MDSKHFCWIVAYVEAKFIFKVQRELDRYPEFAQVEAFIPTVKIVDKLKKGKQEFTEVPLLFNYGFFKVPRTLAIHHKFLESMQKNISCIYGWVRDPLKKTKTDYPSEDATADKIKDKHIHFATATSKEIQKLVKDALTMSTHSSDDLDKLKPGDYIILKGYPFEGTEAEFVSINTKKQEVTVKILIFEVHKTIKVSYDNVFFNMYQNENYDDSLSLNDSLDKMSETQALDKLTFKKSNRES